MCQKSNGGEFATISEKGLREDLFFIPILNIVNALPGG